MKQQKFTKHYILENQVYLNLPLPSHSRGFFLVPCSLLSKISSSCRIFLYLCLRLLAFCHFENLLSQQKYFITASTLTVLQHAMVRRLMKSEKYLFEVYFNLFRLIKYHGNIGRNLSRDCTLQSQKICFY